MTDSVPSRNVFVAGGTGYMGRALIPKLVARGHRVHTLVRPGSEDKVPPGCTAIAGNALAFADYPSALASKGLPKTNTFVHLIGVAHPSPAKAAEFRSIDLASIQAAAPAAAQAGIAHFVYLSVAQPAPAMMAYQAVRAEGEALLRQLQSQSGMACTFIRPWYVLGPGHRWPYALLPLYWLCERVPATREGALRLGLVTLPQMIAALVHSVENPADGVRIMTVPDIRNAAFTPTTETQRHRDPNRI